MNRLHGVQTSDNSIKNRIEEKKWRKSCSWMAVNACGENLYQKWPTRDLQCNNHDHKRTNLVWIRYDTIRYGWLCFSSFYHPAWIFIRLQAIHIRCHLSWILAQHFYLNKPYRIRFKDQFEHHIHFNKYTIVLCARELFWLNMQFNDDC